MRWERGGGLRWRKRCVWWRKEARDGLCRWGLTNITCGKKNATIFYDDSSRLKIKKSSYQCYTCRILYIRLHVFVWWAGLGTPQLIYSALPLTTKVWNFHRDARHNQKIHNKAHARVRTVCTQNHGNHAISTFSPSSFSGNSSKIMELKMD